ncbi:UvrB/uvrC motif protein [Posidoniimonas polymericola]|uniref:UvrB/uvrC motif protein n=1 Tax=Posidoniimonas polymericola TaxID=2528002 RepID=A0A5C5YMA8_9BACT|nr:UvrB/UvrC motif-containing protein [Posidoniimonas polymericola]TWT75960.1 UvrB/uvrC motif protein [Posidoniimonas polymericola]
MTRDIRKIIDDWNYAPDTVTTRLITGDDGREKVQLRLDLGLLQMELEGRPDGQTIQGAESLLTHHQIRQREHDAANPDGLPYLLESEDCTELMREGVQYYHRYICFWQLERYELCARDTNRNLDLFRFVREHARYDRDKVQFDQWRPYVTMMHARAVATPLVELQQWEAAIGAIDAGIRGVEGFLSDYGQVDQAERMSELVFLKRWRRELVRKAAPESEEDDSDDDPVAQVKSDLEKAIEEERYEDAAQLRDELKRLENPPPPTGHGGPQ